MLIFERPIIFLITMLREELLSYNLHIIISWRIFFWFEAILREKKLTTISERMVVKG